MRSLLLLSLLLPGLALADPPAAATGRITWSPPGAPQLSLELPANPVASLQHEQRLYVAMGPLGVAIFDTSSSRPVHLATRTFEGDAVGLTLVEGRPWVLLQQLSARPLVDLPAGAQVARTDGGTSSTAAGATGSSVPSAGVALHDSAGLLTGTVLETGPGYVIIDRGLRHGLATENVLRFLSRVQIDAKELGGDAGQPVYREEEAGYGRVSTAGPDRSRVTLARGVRVQVGARFERPIDRRGIGLLAPRRMTGVTELAAELRPFLAVGTLGLGSINEVGVHYRGENPYFVEARLHPFTAGWSREGNLISLSALAMGGYDHQVVGIGVGIGFTAANTGVTENDTRFVFGGSSDETSGGAGYSPTFENVNQGMTIGQLVRLGSRDGLHVEVRNTFVLGTVQIYEIDQDWLEENCTSPYYEYSYYYCDYSDAPKTLTDEYKEIRWGSTHGRIVIPVSPQMDIFTDIGGGSSGYFGVEGGVQTWVRGNGDKGSIGVSVAAGFGLMSGRPDEDTRVDLLGPLLSFGVRRRW